VKREAYPWWTEFVALAGVLLLRLLGTTWRYEIVPDPAYAQALAAGEKFVYAFWHSRILPLSFSRRDEGIAVLVSRHRDGQLITRVIERLGFVTARGSSTRGGEAGVRELLSRAREQRHLAITPDGPRGPVEELKEGLPFVAAHLQRRVVMIAGASHPQWVLRSWDRFRIPKPFARVRVAYSAPIAVDKADEETRRALECALRELTAANSSAGGEPA
jgi:lysophospholipid acyltransferase (LPLAT)-like uncharacterized protein